MEKWSLSGTSQSLPIYLLKSLMYFQVTIIILYTCKNNKPSFVTGALVPIKLPLLTQNTHICISEMKNCHLVAPKNFCEFRQVH